MANALLYYLIVINIVTFVVYGIDKLKAKQGSLRYAPAALLSLPLINAIDQEDHGIDEYKII